MFDITRLQDAIRTAQPEYIVDISSDLFTTTKYTTVQTPVIILSIPHIKAQDTQVVAQDGYSELGSLLFGIVPLTFRCPIADVVTVYNNIDQVCRHFQPVPENENFSSFSLNSGETKLIKDKVITYYLEWVYQFPRVV